MAGIAVAAFLIAAPLFCGFSYAGEAGAIDVKIYLDRDSGGWMDKVSDYAFLVERDGCKIQWNAIEEKSGERRLRVRRDCEKPFSEQAPLHQAILRHINSRWAISSFRYINWGPLCSEGDWGWCIKIAEASMKSLEFIEHCKKYRNIEMVSPNPIFIKLANETHAYKELSDILKEFGVNIRIRIVQKVFSFKLRQTPFYDQMKGLKVKGNPRVMYDVGEAYFYFN
jgi:hypothetical protein